MKVFDPEFDDDVAVVARALLKIDFSVLVILHFGIVADGRRIVLLRLNRIVSE